MRISSVKEATDKYTGCVLVGNYSYAYFDPIDYRFQTVKVNEGASTVTNLDRMDMLRVYIPIYDFVKQDFSRIIGDFTEEVIAKYKIDYKIRLEFYISGKLELELGVVLPWGIKSFLRNMAVMLTTFVYLLSSLTEAHDFRIEYICDYYRFGMAYSFFYSKSVSEYLLNYDSITLCISYKSGNTEERTYLCTDDKSARTNSDFDISIYLYHGYGVCTEDGILVCWESDDGLKAVELTGKDCRRKAVKKVAALALSDFKK